MKGLNKAWALALIPMLASCADYFDTAENFEVDKPESVAQYEYLNAYGPLKTYIDRNAHPGFLLGTGVIASDYLKKGGVYLLTNSNFDQVTAGNAMKYASCVSDEGNMDFGAVRDFVDAATGAGLSVYGHTLCWHAQQRPKWLNSLIADKEIEYDPDAKVEVQDYIMDYTLPGASYNFWHAGEVSQIAVNATEGCLEIVNPTEDPDNWHIQYHIADGLPIEKGKDYTLKMMIRATGEGTVNIGVGTWSGRPATDISFNTEWKEETFDFTASDNGGFVMAQSGRFVGTIQIKYVKIVHYEAPQMSVFMPMVEGGDAESGPQEWFIARSGGDNPAQVVSDPLGTGNVFMSPIVSNPTNSWDSQFFIKANTILTAGEKVKVSFRYRCDDTRNIETQAHGAPGAYHHWSCIGTLNATSEWQDFVTELTVGADHVGDDGFQTIAFNLASTPDAGTFYIDDIVFSVERKTNTIPLTPSEKREILTAELERWIKGMMEATEGKVTAWDVVNEPISGGGGARYDLQHGTPDNTTDFFWQDYLGDDFARIPVKFARKYFEEFGGNPADLKLFINDYNLESWRDDNKKLKSLISWIEQWESDGETVIDGIGSQMHISYSMNPEDQKNREDHIVKMFELLANSGKLIRITELDMGIVDESDNAIMTPDLTFEMKMKMADYYKFVVEKYFEIIPSDKQYGICQWSQTDSPVGSGWRAGEPIGLWDENLSRKPAFGGFADGLAGK